MTTTPAAWIISTGARAPVGLSSLQVAMCARAKKMEPETTRFTGRTGHPMGACRMLAVPRSVQGYERLGRIAAPALSEALLAGVPGPVPLIVALPEPGRADDDPRLTQGFVADLALRGRLPLDVKRSVTLRAGRAGFAAAVDAALAMLHNPAGPEMVLAGGADSYFHRDVMSELDEALRVHGPGTEDGFIPSEGAAFVLLRRPGAIAEDAPAPLAAVRRVVLGLEEDDPNTGRAMTAILHAMREDGPVPWVLTDVNGEPERTREWTLAEIRALAPDGEAQHDRFASELGDMGAATGAVLAVIATSFLATGCAPAKDAVIALASDGPTRGAIRVEEVR